MPGIVTIIQKKPNTFDRNRNILQKMTKAATHEPFYRCQIMESAEIGLHAGSIYLDHECASVGVEHDSIVCLFNGELFSMEDVWGESEKDGNRRLSNADACRLIISLYKLKGLEFLKDLNGYFNLLLLDKRDMSAVVANDRFGMHKLFYAKLPDGGMMFSPEVKCFKHHPDLKVSLDFHAIVQNFKYTCPLENRSFYNEVKRVPIASCFHLKDGQWSISSYWSPESVQESGTLPLSKIKEKAVERLNSIVEDYYEPGNTGMSLTGGWDTRVILSILTKKGHHLPCYTFSGMYRESFDVQIARHLAERTYNPYERLVLGREFLNNIEKWANKAIYISDGLAKVSNCHEYYLNLLAREYGGIRLTGKYGSQIIRGISLIKDRSPDLRIFQDDFRHLFSNSSVQIRQDLAYAIRWEYAQYMGAKHSQEMAALKVRTPYLDNTLVDLMLRAPLRVDAANIHRQVIRQNTPEWISMPTNRGAFVERTIYHTILRKWYGMLNLACSAYNWERLPSWATKACRITDILNISPFFNGRNEWTHYRQWFLSDLKDFARSVILDPDTLARPFYNRQFLEKMLQSHFAQKENFTQEIDRIMSFELWYRQNQGNFAQPLETVE